MLLENKPQRAVAETRRVLRRQPADVPARDPDAAAAGTIQGT